MTPSDDPELERLLVNARKALERYHRLAGFPADIVAAAEALSKEAADALDAYRKGKATEDGNRSG